MPNQVGSGKFSCSIKRVHRGRKRHNDACLLPASARTVGSTLSTGFNSAGTQPIFNFEVTTLDFYSTIFRRFKADGFTQLPYYRLPTLKNSLGCQALNILSAWFSHVMIVPHLY